MFYVVLIIIIIVYLVEVYTINNALKGIEFTQRFSINIVEPDEKFEIISILQNRTRRFVSFLRLSEKISNEIIIYAKTRAVNDIANIDSTQYLKPKQKLERRVTASIPKRGRYFIYGANIETKLSGFLGDISVNRFILEDPVLTIGFNDYTGYEPQKMISCTQSARNNKLMVKKYDYTQELQVTVILNVDYKGDNFMYKKEQLRVKTGVEVCVLTAKQEEE